MVQITEKNLKICNGNKCAAALIPLFTDTWSEINITETQNKLLNFFTEDEIRKALQYLVQQEILENEDNLYRNKNCSAPTITNKDLIAILGKALLETETITPSSKAYAIAGRLYNQYDFVPAERAIQTLSKKKNIDNPIPYLFATAKSISQKLKSDSNFIYKEKKSRKADTKICNRLLAKRLKKVQEIYQSKSVFNGLCVIGDVPDNFKKG